MYVVVGVELDTPRDFRGDYRPEVDGGWDEEFETLEEAIECYNEALEDKYQDAKIEGPDVPRQYKFYHGSYLF